MPKGGEGETKAERVVEKAAVLFGDSPVTFISTRLPDLKPGEHVNMPDEILRRVMDIAKVTLADGVPVVTAQGGGGDRVMLFRGIKGKLELSNTPCVSLTVSADQEVLVCTEETKGTKTEEWVPRLDRADQPIHQTTFWHGLIVCPSSDSDKAAAVLLAMARNFKPKPYHWRSREDKEKERKSKPSQARNPAAPEAVRRTDHLQEVGRNLMNAAATEDEL